MKTEIQAGIKPDPRKSTSTKHYSIFSCRHVHIDGDSNRTRFIPDLLNPAKLSIRLYSSRERDRNLHRGLSYSPMRHLSFRKIPFLEKLTNHPANTQRATKIQNNGY